MKKRIVYLDLLRIIAITAVVMIHVSAENWYVTTVDNNWLMNNFMNSLVGMWAVPMFVTISGALLLGNEKFNIKTLFTKYLPRIILILVVWHTLYYFYENPVLSLNNIIQCIKHLIVGKVYSHLWYLYLVIGLYILTPILNKLVKSLEQKEYIYMLIIGFGLTSVVTTLNYFIDYDLNQLVNPYMVLNFSVMLFYYLLGYYLRKWGIPHSKIILIISIILLIVMSITQNIISIKRGVPISYSGTSNILAVFIVSSLFTVLKNNKKIKDNKIITKLGSLTLGVYLIHFFVEKTLFGFGLNSNVINPILGNILITLIVLIISYMISFLISKAPVIKKIIL